MITEITKESRMADLIDILNDARSKYYGSQKEESSISDAQYDRYLSELTRLEEETGIKLSGSPTMKVGFDEPEEDKIKHYAPVLSLKDTKSVDEMLNFLGEEEGILSWKVDGIGIVLYYSLGKLTLALSRGDGHYGKDITKNVMLMRNVPTTIPILNRVIIRGEGCLSLREFDQIKKTKEGEKYSNPRNTASGLINGTKTTNILLRHMNFVAHSVVLFEGDRYDFPTRELQLQCLQGLGFKVVPHVTVLNFELTHEIERYTREVENFEFPVDGLVLSLNDLKYGESLGATAKFPKHSIAFKWPDEEVLTTVTGMKWSVSPTGLITPVVGLKPVWLEGTEVKQANLHSLKIFEELSIGIGDTLRIFKANKIIPEVADNLTRSRTEGYPRHCPVCDSETTVVITDKTRKLYCYTCGGKEYFK
jgi:DNA ligase (NAD+)